MLRAIAVISVILFHLWPQTFPNGYLGVDVFFCISGYVIFRQIQAGSLENLITAKRFLRRRFNRVFPALSAMVLAVTIISTLVFSPFEDTGSHSLSATAQTALGAMMGIANVVIPNISGDYFDPVANSNPLLHTWSLSAEEQFYLVFGLLFLYATRTKTIMLKRFLFGLMAASAVVSLVVFGMQSQNVSSPDWFYRSDIRAWEFLAGGSVLFMDKLDLWTGNRKAFLSRVGFAILVFLSMSKIETSPVLLLILTAFIIWSKGLLSNREQNIVIKAAVWIGERSYSMYLWHWPTIVFFSYFIAESIVSKTAALVFSLFLGAFSYRFIESPFRNNDSTKKKNIPRVLSLVALTSSLAALFVVQPAFADALSKQGREGEIGHTTFHDVITNNYYPCSPSWFYKSSPNWGGEPRCHQSFESRVPTVAILGDSHAEHLFPGLAEADQETNFVYYLVPDLKEALKASGSKIITHTLDDPNIEIIVLSAWWGLNYSDEVHQFSLDAVARNKKVLLVGDTPFFPFDSSECKFGKGWLRLMQRCEMPLSQRDLTGILELRKLSNEVPGIEYVDLGSTFCSNDVCSMIVENRVMFRDSNHLNIEGSLMVAKELLKSSEFLQEAKFK